MFDYTDVATHPSHLNMKFYCLIFIMGLHVGGFCPIAYQKDDRSKPY